MAYTVDKTNSSASPSSYTVQDNVLNTQTDLKFIGKGYAGYGEVLHENFLHLLENFANATAPGKPIQGQLWYDSGASQLKVYTGSNFVPAGNTVPYGPTAPANLVTGDLWIDSDTAQLFFYNGTSNILIGPTTSAGANTNGFTFESITDNTDTAKNVTKLFNDGNLIAIISEDTFTPKTAISGFSSITKGITLSTAITDLKFAGTATDSDKLGNVAAANYLRSNANDTTTGTLGVLNNSGFAVGTNSDLSLTVDSTGVVMQNIISDKDITFKVNDGGSTTTLMTMDGSSSRVGIGTVTPTTKLDVSGTVNATAFTGPITGAVTGNVTGNVTGDVTGAVTGAASSNLLLTGGTLSGTLNSQTILPSSDSSFNLGTDGTRFATAFLDTLDATEIKSQGVTINDNSITASRSNDNLEISASGTGDVNINSNATLSGSFAQAIHTFTATDAITAAEHAGRILLLGEVGGNADVVLTLPDATGSGNVYEFIVSVTIPSNTYKIACPDADNTITGQIQYLDEDGTAVTAFPTVSASDTITLNGGTQGGRVGDTLTLIDIAADKWMVKGLMRVAAGANPATPFTAAVS
jgi:hypothetical protein